MVLILCTEKADEARQAGKKDSRYTLSSFQSNVALLYDASADVVPGEEAVERALMLTDVPEHPSFFVTPFGGLIQSTDAERDGPLALLLSDVSHCVARRENVTLINRGVKSDMYLESLLLSLVDAIRSSAEYAMQIVADEIAKEKQMQRLLQLENENDTEAKEVLRTALAESNKQKEAVRGLPLSKRLRRQLRELDHDYPYAPAAAAHSAQTATGASADRYTVLSSVNGVDLKPPCKEGSSLAPTSFTVNPPKHRRKHQSSASPRERNYRSHSFLFNERQQRSTLAVLSELEDKPAGVDDLTALKGNGWGDVTRMFVFDGDASVMALPGVPRFDEIVRSFSVDFWIRTDLRAADGKRVLLQILDGQRGDLGQLFQVSLNWYEEMEDAIRVFCRDSANRVIEALIPLSKSTLNSGTEFHHFMLAIHSLEEGEMECLIDGTATDIQIVQQEHPIAFNAWPHRLFVGSCLDEENTPMMVFRGTIMQLRFWSHSGDGERRPMILWPLLVEDGKLVEMTRTIPADHHETLQSLQRVEEPAPPCSPFFDGNLVANLGTLPSWGELMHNWRVEIRFRTDVTNRSMVLMGVTDQKYKMEEIGIVLNAEPVLTQERFRFHELSTTLYVVDAFGACCSMLLRGSDRQTLVDGAWHTLVWRCVDSEANKFTVKVDGIVQDVLFVRREGPRRFAAFDDWVCLGGHNVRNWKVKQTYTGQIGRFYLSLRGHPYVTLNMNEGPGAYVLQDRSGHGNHGLLIHPDTGVVRKNDTTWVPSPVEKSREAVGGAGDEEVLIFANNNVSIAGVVFTCDFDEKGVVYEVMYDLYHRANCEPAVVEHHVADARPHWKTWRCIPDSCFKPLDTVVQLEEAVNVALSAQLPRGHLMIVVRIGDCHVTLLHVRDPELPADATYNCQMLKWRYAYAVVGSSGRRELLLNRMIEGMEGVLVSDTFTPFTTARLGPLNSGDNTVVSEDIIRRLQNSGRPWFLAATLHHQLLNSQYGSSLHILQHIYPSMSYDEAAAATLVNKRLHDGTKAKAALVIQRNWRGKLARHDAAQREGTRKLRDRRVEEIRTFRMNPVVQAKQKLYALLILLHQPTCQLVPPIRANTRDLEESLRKQGYEVDRLENADAPTVMKAISKLDADRSTFIYISGYGGQLHLRQPPLFSLQALHLHLSEGAARAGVESEQGQLFRQLLVSAAAEKAGIKPKKKKKGNNATAAAPSRGKRKTPEEDEAAARQEEMAMRSAQLEVEQEETFLREEILKEYDNDVRAITREIRHTVVATREYEMKYLTPADENSGPRHFIYPCESHFAEPYATTVLDLEDVVRTALHRQAPPVGLQSIVAIDLEPVTAYSCGVACLASSTGNTFVIPYQPHQRRLLSWHLLKAFDGYLPTVPASSKYAVLTGGIETEPNQRDWKSFASYIVSKMQPICTPEVFAAMRAELDRELAFTAELIPIRDIVLTGEAQDRLRRDMEAQKVTVNTLFGVGSMKVQSDMFALFKGILENLPLSEIAFTNAIHIIFSNQNRGIDAADVASLTKEVEKLRPSGCAVPITLELTAQGARVSFDLLDSSDRLFLTQWLNSIVVRSITWQIPKRPIEGYGCLDVEYVEYLYSVKTTCNQRRFRELMKQFYTTPIVQPFVRFLSCDTLTNS